MAETKQVIDWLQDKIEREGSIVITEAADQVSHFFGAEFVTETEGGEWTLIEPIKREFNSRMGDRIYTAPVTGDWTWILRS